MTNWGEAFSGDVSFPHSGPDARNLGRRHRRDAARGTVPHGARTHRPVVVSRSARVGTDCVHTGSTVGSTPCAATEGVSRTRRTARSRRSSTAPAPATWNSPTAARANCAWNCPHLFRWTVHGRSPPFRQGVGLTAPVKISLDKLVSWRDIAELRTYAGIATLRDAVRCSAGAAPRRPGSGIGTGRGLRIGRRVAQWPACGDELVCAALPGRDEPRQAGSEYVAHRRAQRPQEPPGTRRLCPALGPAGPGADPARRARRSGGTNTVIESLSRRARLAVLLAAIAGLLFDGVELG